jgi:hypothetical protein
MGQQNEAKDRGEYHQAAGAVVAVLAGLVVLIAILAAVPRRVPSMGRVRGESAGSIGSSQHDYLRLQDELIAKP